MPIFTHDRISLSSGLLNKLTTGRHLWGNNALQNVTIGRNTPKEVQQAIGHLGIVDYVSGTITSDVQLDTVLVEACDKAVPGSSVYKYGNVPLAPGSESYVATAFNLGFTAGSPATFGVQLLTSGLASYLDVEDQPTPETGEESSFAVVMGDDGSGCIVVATWDGATPVTGTVSVIDKNNNLDSQIVSDNGLPAGIQSLNFSANINRDQILDIRSASPVQYTTSYPIDITVDMEVYQPPHYGTNTPGGANYNPDREDTATPVFGGAWDKLRNISVQALALDKHPTGTNLTPPTAGEAYVNAIGLTKQSETETAAVGRSLMYNVSFTAADLEVPMPDLDVPLPANNT